MHRITHKPARLRGLLSLVAGAAILALAWAGLASSAVTANGSGLGAPTRATGDSWASSTQKLAADDLGRVQLVVVQTVCNLVQYPLDGVPWFSACNTRDYSGGSTWTSLTRKVWNVPPSQGGHSDIFHALWSTANEDDYNIADGETRTQTADRTISTSNTVWVQITNGATGYHPGQCRRAYFSADGGASSGPC
jgi:hypothetical protein